MGNRRHTVWDTDWLGRKTSTTTWDDSQQPSLILGGIFLFGLVALFFGAEAAFITLFAVTVLYFMACMKG